MSRKGYVVFAAGLIAVACAASAQEPQNPAPTAPAHSPVAQAQAQAEADRTEAWRQAITEMLPLSAPETKEFRDAYLQQERAAAPRVAPKGAFSEAVPVSLAPGAQSPMVTLMHGYVTAIEVVDRTGQPWPILMARSGDSEAVEVIAVGAERGEAVAADAGAPDAGVSVPSSVARRDGSGQANVITISPLKMFRATNLLLVLQDESRPVSLVLVPTEATKTTALQDRITLLVDAAGPFAAAPVVGAYDRLDAGEDLRRTLVGQTPVDGAVEILTSLPPGMRAWISDATLWLRTRLQIVSPAPEATIAMGDMRAYRLPYLPSVVLLKDGRLSQIAIRPDLPGGAP